VVEAVHEARDAGFAADAAEALVAMYRSTAASGSDVGRRELPAAERAAKLARAAATLKQTALERTKALAAALATESLAEAVLGQGQPSIVQASFRARPARAVIHDDAYQS